MRTRSLGPGLRHLRVSLLALSFGAALSLSQPAFAQSPEEIKIARQMAGEAFTAYKAGEFEKARGLFSQARALYPSAQIVRLAGYSELALEHWEKAVELLEESLSTKIAPLDETVRKDVQEQLAKGLAHFGTIILSSRVPSTEFAVDGGTWKPMPEKPLRLLEGKHKIAVRAKDHLDVSEDVKVEGGTSVGLALDPKEKVKAPPPPPPPPPKVVPPPSKGLFPNQKLIGYGLVGGGVALGIGALATALTSMKLKSLADEDTTTHNGFYGDRCQRGDYRLCSFDVSVINNQLDQAAALGNASIGLLVGAVVLGGGGAALILTAPKPAKPPPKDEHASPPPPSASIGCGLTGGLGFTCAGQF
ncbi:MAG: hypothetical protein ABI193_03205 [Minicystis sp.]